MSPRRKQSRVRRPRAGPRRLAKELEEVISVDSLAAGGDGVGRLGDGRVVFVRFAAPGDRVRIRVPDSGDSFLRAKEFELLEPGRGRKEPVCEYFERCGGCAWQHLDYETQLEAKQRILRDALERIGKLTQLPAIEVVPSPRPYGYRGRTRVLGRGAHVGYRRYHEHALEPVTRCPVLVPALEAELEALAARVREQHEAGSAAEDREWELAVGRDGRVRCTELDTGVGPRVELEVAGEIIRVAPGGFAQANPLLYQTMFDRVAAALESASAGTLVELFAGAGFFTLGLARRFRRVIAVESDATACTDLSENLATAKLANIEVRNARVEEVLDDLCGRAPDALVLDPPRTGLARGTAGKLAAVRAPHIAYLSCDPATLARDLAQLSASGYRLRSLTAIDVFPQTPHVEALASLEAR
ncbi:MAG: class I SAM-dependent RNA methyltransferase [bacterium]|nr:class I SAM-dependent RNA methyltransferase [bacterium]